MYAAGALGNLAENIKSRRVIWQEGGIKALMMVVREGSQEAQVQAAHALTNLGQMPNQDVTREGGGIFFIS